MSEEKVLYKTFELPNGLIFQIKFDSEGVVYDLFRGEDHVESFGYDLYDDLENIAVTFAQIAGVSCYEEAINFGRWVANHHIQGFENRDDFWFDTMDGTHPVKPMEQIFKIFKEEQGNG